MIVERRNRTLYLSGLPDTVDGITGLPTTLEIEISYAGDPNCFKAISLDNVVIPAIVKALDTMGTMARTEEKLSHGCYGFYCRECDGPRED